MTRAATIAAGLRLLADGLEMEDQPEAPKDGALSVQQAATALGVSKFTVYQQVRSGNLKALHIGKAVRIPASELEAFRRRRLR